VTPPPAATAAGRGKKAAKRSGAKRASSSARGGLATPPGATSRASGRVSARHATRTVRRGAAPRASRRISGPAAGLAVALPRPQVAPLGPRLVAFASTLPDRSVVERMVRGRVWIGVLAFLLIGLVAMQVSLLKLNAGIGSAVERSSALERANGELRAQVSQLESGERIQENAAALGMVMPPAGQISYLRSGRGPGDAAAALREGVFNDPARAIPLPGTDEPPDPLAAALAQGEVGAATEDGSTEDVAAGEETSSEESSTGEAAPGDGTASEETTSGETTGGETSSGEGSSAAESAAAGGMAGEE
jgi:hypothetical protein